MNLAKLSATPRSTRGKGAARRLRREGQIPAVAYGKGSDSTPISISPKDLQTILAGELGRNTVIELDTGKDKIKVLMAELQSHPLTREPLHADFLRVADDQEIEVSVPFELTGKAQGVVMGGTLHKVFRRLPVRCLPAAIPVKLSHDVTELGLEQQVKARDVSVPDGVSIRLHDAQTVAGVVTGRKAKDEEAAPGEAAAEGEAPAAAPAEAGADDKKKS